MILDMSDAFEGLTTLVNLDTYQLQSVNYVTSMTRIDRKPINAVIQPATHARLMALTVDFSLKYIQIHSPIEPIAIGQYIEFDGVNYKIIDLGDYQLYGFYEAIGEQTKGNIT